MTLQSSSGGKLPISGTRKTAAILAAFTVTTAFILWSWIDREPEYNGKPLSYWVDQVLIGEYRENPTAALRAIGPPAAAPLVRALSLTDSTVRRRYSAWRSRLPSTLYSMLPAERLAAPHARNNAFSALCVMGRTARYQVPELRQLLKHTDRQVRIYAILVLANIGPDAEAALPELRAAAAEAPELRAHVAEATRQIQASRTLDHR